MERNQFTFYRSYRDALRALNAKDFKAVVLAICDYALDESEPCLSGVPHAVFTLIRPTLDSGRNKAANRQNRIKTKKEQSGNKSEQTRKHKEREKETEKDNEREKENDSSLSISLSRKVPTFDEVAEYAKLRGGLIDPKPFYEFYSVAGWRDTEGKPVYNWQQKFQLWEKRELEKKGGAMNGHGHDTGRDAKKWNVPGAVNL